MSPKTYLYLLYNEIIYDTIYEEYYNILTLNKTPEGALKTYTQSLALTKPSHRDLITKECAIVIKNELLNNQSTNNQSTNNQYYSNILTLNQLNEFTEFLINNNYIITNNITNIITNNITNNFKKIIYSFKITL